MAVVWEYQVLMMMPKSPGLPADRCANQRTSDLKLAGSWSNTVDLRCRPSATKKSLACARSSSLHLDRSSGLSRMAAAQPGDAGSGRASVRWGGARVSAPRGGLLWLLGSCRP